MINVLHGDCCEIMPTLEAESFDAIVTDPPAGISFMSKAWDGNKGGRDHWITWMQSVASECLRLAKPGAHALVWALPRTSHWTATAWENAGWVVRDRVSHLFGSGMPKSLDVSKAIDDHFFHEWLRAHPEYSIRLNGLMGDAKMDVESELRRVAGLERKVVGSRLGSPGYSLADNGRTNRVYGDLHDPIAECAITAPATPEAAQWIGHGTGLKPACEDWWLLRKPLSERTVAANVLKYGCGALNIDATRIPGAKPDTTRGSGGKNGRYGPLGALVRIEDDGRGRFPANLAHDNSPEVLEAFAAFGEGSSPATYRRTTAGEDAFDNVYSGGKPRPEIQAGFGDSGSPARFFFSAKANAEDRLGSRHPTIKPTNLMAWLLRLVVPPGGHVLDPFAGSGSTGMAAMREGFDATLIEMEEESVKDIHNRLAHVHGHDTPLFAGNDEAPPQTRDLFDGSSA